MPSHVVALDFDGTCTLKSLVSLFEVIEENSQFDPNWKKANDRLKKKFLPRFIKGQFSPHDAKEWMTATINLFVEYRWDMKQIATALMNVRFRSGFRETLEWLKRHQIPVAIISYGIADFIETALRKESLTSYIDQVFSARLVFNKDTGIIRGHLPETVVLPHQKGQLSREFAEFFSVSPDRILAIGDSSVDRFLGHLKKNRLGLARDQEEKEKLQKYMGTVYITSDFHLAQTWLARRLEIDQ